jgi:hypothetical protein
MFHGFLQFQDQQTAGRVLGVSDSDGVARRTPASTDDLAEFMLARIAEREQLARAALPHYAVHDCGRHGSELVAFRSHTDPAFVLKECAAIRQIIELHVSALQMRRSDDPYQAGYIKAMRDDRMLRLIALPYAGHPCALNGVPPASDGAAGARPSPL